jgi:protein-S-isoprenylcysteine O-methyltransferase Ste14
MAKITPEQEPARAPAAETAGHVTLSRWAAAVVTILSLPFGPGLVVVLLPWLITHWQQGLPPYPVAVRALGAVLIAAGGVVILATFIRFPAEGSGTPFPTNPPTSQRVMRGGPYRYVRNPMYVAFLTANAGQALLLTRPVLFIYAGGLHVALIAFVRLYEERTMAQRFGAEYEAYCRQVPGWWPRPPRRRS